jgi:hypothetical protein
LSRSERGGSFFWEIPKSFFVENRSKRNSDFSSGGSIDINPNLCEEINVWAKYASVEFLKLRKGTGLAVFSLSKREIGRDQNLSSSRAKDNLCIPR